MSGLKAVLFDFDDTILNSFPARVEAAKSAAQGILDPGLNLDRIMREWAGRPQYEIWKQLTGDDGKSQALMDGYWKSYWVETGVEAPLFPVVRDMLVGLKNEGFCWGSSPPRPVSFKRTAGHMAPWWSLSV